MQSRLSYTTLDGHTLDLSLLSKEESAFFERCYEAYLRGRGAQDFTRLANLVAGPDNLLVKRADGRITPTVGEHPLYQAVRDLEDRLGIRVGELEAVPGDHSADDPLSDGRLTSGKAARPRRGSITGQTARRGSPET